MLTNVILSFAAEYAVGITVIMGGIATMIAVSIRKHGR